MTYNIHPIFVHFPIAFLLLYSVIKILPFRRWFRSVNWVDVERVLLVFGVLGAFVALQTGELAEKLTMPNKDIVEAHSFFATTSTWVYILILVGEIISISLPWLDSKIKSQKILNILIKVKNILIKPVVTKILAAVGFITITLTGLLGGVMVYGTSADPFAKIVLKLLGIEF